MLMVGSDKTLPQIGRMRELLSRGIGIHHGGLLPLVKGTSTLSFPTTPLIQSRGGRNPILERSSQGPVRDRDFCDGMPLPQCNGIIADRQGVNMPAKSVVFSGIRKFDSHNFRNLLPGEYTQMAGRAGRRGLDTTGTVIILSGDELPSVRDPSQVL